MQSRIAPQVIRVVMITTTFVGMVIACSNDGRLPSNPEKLVTLYIKAAQHGDYDALAEMTYNVQAAMAAVKRVYPRELWDDQMNKVRTKEVTTFKGNQYWDQFEWRALNLGRTFPGYHPAVFRPSMQWHVIETKTTEAKDLGETPDPFGLRSLLPPGDSYQAWIHASYQTDDAPYNDALVSQKPDVFSKKLSEAVYIFWLAWVDQEHKEGLAVWSIEKSGEYDKFFSPDELRVPMEKARDVAFQWLYTMMSADVEEAMKVSKVPFAFIASDGMKEVLGDKAELRAFYEDSFEDQKWRDMRPNTVSVSIKEEFDLPKGSREGLLIINEALEPLIDKAHPEGGLYFAFIKVRLYEFEGYEHTIVVYITKGKKPKVVGMYD